MEEHRNCIYKCTDYIYNCNFCIADYNAICDKDYDETYKETDCQYDGISQVHWEKERKCHLENNRPDKL